MGISKRYLDTNERELRFDPQELGARLEEALPEVVFAYLMGSSVDGVVRPHSDLDIALFVDPALERAPDLYARVSRTVEEMLPGVRCDMGILNGTEPVYRFEALKGRLLFCRGRDRWLDFYSLTCREYESQMVHYERQRKYRMERQR